MNASERPVGAEIIDPRTRSKVDREIEAAGSVELDTDFLDQLAWNRNVEHDREIPLGAKWGSDPLLDKRIQRRRAIQRADVFAAVAECARSRRWNRALVAVNAWGYGKAVGYGHYRTTEILKQRDFSRSADKAAQLVRSGQPITAYYYLNNRVGHIKGWGPAFFTKFLYFNDDPNAGKALILDAILARALNRVVGQDTFRSTGWRTPQYAYYLTVMHRICARANASGGVVESVLFKHFR